MRTWLAAAGAVAAFGTGGAAPAPPQPVFSHPATIDNPYLPLTTHRRCVLRCR